MVIHVYHPYRQPDGENHCQAVNGHCSHLCLPAPQINSNSPKISCACPESLRMLQDGLTCVQDGMLILFKRILIMCASKYVDKCYSFLIYYFIFIFGFCFSYNILFIFF